MKEFALQLLSLMLPLIAAVLTGLGTWGARLLFKKLHVDLGERQEAALRSAARGAIFAAEEWGQRKLKEKGIKVEGRAKKERAVATLAQRFPQLLPEDLKRVMKEEIAFMPGMGATGNPNDPRGRIVGVEEKKDAGEVQGHDDESA